METLSTARWNGLDKGNNMMEDLKEVLNLVNSTSQHLMELRRDLGNLFPGVAEELLEFEKRMDKAASILYGHGCVVKTA